MKRSGEEKLSRHLSFLLRHSAEFVDAQGWASLSSVISASRLWRGDPVSEKEIRSIVASDKKGRYEINNGRVRATQGHSVSVDLGWSAETPPPVLFHGTVERFIPSILGSGLLPQSRTYVHLSETTNTALSVGARRSGETVILSVDTIAAVEDGAEFFKAANGVWLTKRIAPQFITGMQ